MILRTVYRTFWCHLCEDEDREYSSGSNLRRHWTIEHGASLPKKSRDRRAVMRELKENVFISKNQTEDFRSEDYDVWYMCAGCDNHYLEKENIISHIKESHTINVLKNELPIKVNLPKKTIAIKKRKTQDSINQSLFQLTTPHETYFTKSLLSSFNTGSVSLCLSSNNPSTYVDANLPKDEMNVLSGLSDISVKTKIEVAEVKIEKIQEKTVYLGKDYLHQFLQSSKYSGLMKDQEYEIVNDSILKLLNQDWKNGSHYRIASGQILAGAILVDGRQILLINCIELYNRKSSMDAHYDRFGVRFRIDSTPYPTNNCGGLNIISKMKDKLQKLIIGTMVFNGLVTSSLRLDKENSVPEVGDFTCDFIPSKETVFYIPRKSIKTAVETLSTKAEVSNSSDLDSQLRQVRSYLTNPKTYEYSRFSSEWTDALPFRPYTIFTLIEKSNTDPSLDYMVASSILLKVADSIRFKKGIMSRDMLKEVVTDQKKTTAKKMLVQIFELYGDEENLNLIGNKKLEEILVELAKIATNQLKLSNESIKLSIDERMSKAFN